MEERVTSSNAFHAINSNRTCDFSTGNPLDNREEEREEGERRGGRERGEIVGEGEERERGGRERERGLESSMMQ